ncbi:hypothetical protein R3P38DRAFT_3064201, partial [Favolaschia claudopus]
MKLLAVVALLAATTSLPAYAVPIPEIEIISPYMTQFAQRTAAAGLVSRIPGVVRVERAHDDDIFLTRALEDTIFMSSHEVIAAQRSRLTPLPNEDATEAFES